MQFKDVECKPGFSYRTLKTVTGVKKKRDVIAVTSFIRTPLANTDSLLGPFGVPIREVPTVVQFCRFSLGLLQRGDYCEWTTSLISYTTTWLKHGISIRLPWNGMNYGKNKFKYTFIFKKEPSPRGTLQQVALDWLSRLKVSSFTEHHVKQITIDYLFIVLVWIESVSWNINQPYFSVKRPETNLQMTLTFPKIARFFILMSIVSGETGDDFGKYWEC